MIEQRLSGHEKMFLNLTTFVEDVNSCVISAGEI